MPRFTNQQMINGSVGYKSISFIQINSIENQLKTPNIPLSQLIIISGQTFILLNQIHTKMKKEVFGVIGGISLGVIIPPLVNFISALKKNNDNKLKLAGKRFVGIELGGTNYNVAIAEPILNNKGQIIDFRIIKRKSGITYANPEESLTEIIDFIKIGQIQSTSQISKQEVVEYHFIGIASFGPICLNKANEMYGAITTTPKQLWRGMKILDRFKHSFPVPVGIDTDVNAAAYAQFKLGNHQVRQSLAYITVGTGVGVGVIAQGKTVHGLTHPEGGHIVVERASDEYENFKGVCPYHKNQICLEGMVCNKSIAQRLQVDFTALADIPDDSKVWKLVAYYLAQLCLNITLLISPEVIVIGGGIMNRKILYSYIHKQFLRLLGGYVEHPLFSTESIGKYILAPRLGSDVGVKGAMILSTMQQ